ncbi:MAG: hypothetical protein HUJ98_13100 [Bacteroidaceae bacterium]|nr:hypothetical protein [Bacteroidaceae bacterium]
MESILTHDDNHCFECGRYIGPGTRHIHHVIEGNGRRGWSEKFGLKIPLCLYCHRTAHDSNRQLLDKWKIIAQTEWESRYAPTNDSDHAEWRKYFGKSYLED